MPEFKGGEPHIKYREKPIARGAVKAPPGLPEMNSALLLHMIKDREGSSKGGDEYYL